MILEVIEESQEDDFYIKLKGEIFDTSLPIEFKRKWIRIIDIKQDKDCYIIYFKINSHDKEISVDKSLAIKGNRPDLDFTIGLFGSPMEFSRMFSEWQKQKGSVKSVISESENGQKIYSSREEASRAIKEMMTKIEALENEYSVKFEDSQDDYGSYSCKYKDSSGQIRNFNSNDAV